MSAFMPQSTAEAHSARRFFPSGVTSYGRLRGLLLIYPIGISPFLHCIELMGLQTTSFPWLIHDVPAFFRLIIGIMLNNVNKLITSIVCGQEGIVISIANGSID